MRQQRLIIGLIVIGVLFCVHQFLVWEHFFEFEDALHHEVFALFFWGIAIGLWISMNRRLR